MQMAGIVFLSAVCLLLVWAAALLIFVEMRRLHRKQVWRTVAGRIVDLQPATFDSEYGTYTAHAEYQYELFGTNYSGSAEVSWPKSGVGAEYLSEPYHLGSQLWIAYNPDQPAQSVLADDIGGSISALLGILFGIGMIGFTAFVLWAALPDMIAGLFPWDGAARCRRDGHKEARPTHLRPDAAES